MRRGDGGDGRGRGGAAPRGRSADHAEREPRWPRHHAPQHLPRARRAPRGRPRRARRPAAVVPPSGRRRADPRAGAPRRRPLAGAGPARAVGHRAPHVAGRDRRRARRRDPRVLPARRDAFAAGSCARYPSVVSTDGSAAQNAVQLPFRRPGRFTPFTARVGEHFERRCSTPRRSSSRSRSGVRAPSGSGTTSAPTDCASSRSGSSRPIRRRRSSTDPDALPEITFTGTSLQRKGGTALLRAYRDAAARPVRAQPGDARAGRARPTGVRVFSDIRPGDPRLVAMLARSAVFALPSEIDKSPYSVLEAMFAGLPVVSTDVGGIPEMVVDGETGFLVPPDDDAAIADAIETLLADDVRRSGDGSRVACARLRALRRAEDDRRSHRRDRRGPRRRHGRRPGIGAVRHHAPRAARASWRASRNRSCVGPDAEARDRGRRRRRSVTRPNVNVHAAR